MVGTLYLVGTPIGNLGDFSPRAQEVLRLVDFIAAEDTRVTLKLLNHFEIKKPLICYFEHNRAEMGEKLLARLLAGESCALVSDAGMPAISDPGEDIVRRCAEHGVTVSCAPGPCALATALAVSGLPTQRFCFEGFLSTASKSRREHLEQLRGERRTMIFYEAPHKLLRTLGDFLDNFGDRDIALCRELTKMHEEIIRTTVSGALRLYEQTPPRGEYVIVLRGAPEPVGPAATREEAVALVRDYRAAGLSLKEAAKKAAAETGFSKNELYSLAVSGD
ncbi:MAG: 16S rRNA (cytidine(1402)-2'-O)-methyltransferase [Butyricicoccus sp.]|nr:16S rRNA (cytidine(1402)-2'-O)-methyltransferase [Butyricicoccus sp.]